MPRRYVGFASVVLVVVLSQSIPCWAEDSMAEPRPLQVSVINVAPHGFRGKDGVAQGIFYDFTVAIMDAAGLPYAITLKPFARIIQELQNGKTDVTHLNLSPATLQIAECLDFTVHLQTIVIGRKGTDFSSLQDLYRLDRPVGLLRGGKYAEHFDNDPAIPKQETNGYRQNVKLLFAERLDAIAGVASAIYHGAKALGYPREQFGAPLVLKEVQSCVYFSKRHAADHAQVMQRLQTTTQHLREHGIFRKISEEWMR